MYPGIISIGIIMVDDANGGKSNPLRRPKAIVELIRWCEEPLASNDNDIVVAALDT
jgi:hypothetical protein